MFRRVFASASRLAMGFGVGGVASVGLMSAAAMAIDQGNVAPTKAAVSDQELKKKPSWYQENVVRLEHVLKKFSLYAYVEDPELIDDAIDILQRVENVNNCELSWRLGRAFVEKSALFPKKEGEKKVHLLEKGIKHLQKAFQLEPSKGSAGAHKWYAVALIRLKDIDSGNAHVKKAGREIMEHLEKAVKLDPNDAITTHLLGVSQFFSGNYDEALKNFRTAEELKKGFFVANQVYLAIALGEKNQKQEGAQIMKEAFRTKPKNKSDSRAKMIGRQYANKKLGLSDQDLSNYEEY